MGPTTSATPYAAAPTWRTPVLHRLTASQNASGGKEVSNSERAITSLSYGS
ncbi:MAG: hypothetical protein JWO76_853 [Nocardioides sp.]|nr:hypothetical protein [Nocardioides sp.]